ncbi:hypothetical protein [Aneurinibacillus aneurinilyticus]|uniref:hypothetical protein n=1 Tax=Aneurinibacillus aneurinilyticus TaxID=1391 RepID=UPI00352352CC
MFCGPAWLGQKAAFYASVRETNRRPFEARCGDDSLWIILDNQPPCVFYEKRKLKEPGENGTIVQK